MGTHDHQDARRRRLHKRGRSLQWLCDQQVPDRSLHFVTAIPQDIVVQPIPALLILQALPKRLQPLVFVHDPTSYGQQLHGNQPPPRSKTSRPAAKCVASPPPPSPATSAQVQPYLDRKS